MPECLFEIGDRQTEKRQLNADRRAICDATRGIAPAHGGIRLRGVSEGSQGVRALWHSHSARTEMFFASGGGGGGIGRDFMPVKG
jgi:hypothetical protein